MAETGDRPSAPNGKWAEEKQPSPFSERSTIERETVSVLQPLRGRELVLRLLEKGNGVS